MRWRKSPFKKDVAKVCIGRVGLKAGRDVVFDVLDVPHLLAPLLVAPAVRKEGDATTTEACHLLGRQPTAASCSQPQVLGVQGCHDDGGLLTLYEAYVCVGTTREQVLTKETLVELPRGRQQSCTDERYVCPPLESVAMTVHAVLHNVAAMHLVLMVNLPEDDVAAACGTDLIVSKDLLKLFFCNSDSFGNVSCHPLPEDTAR